MPGSAACRGRAAPAARPVGRPGRGGGSPPRIAPRPLALNGGVPRRLGRVGRGAYGASRLGVIRKAGPRTSNAAAAIFARRGSCQVGGDRAATSASARGGRRLAFRRADALWARRSGEGPSARRPRERPPTATRRCLLSLRVMEGKKRNCFDRRVDHSFGFGAAQWPAEAWRARPYPSRDVARCRRPLRLLEDEPLLPAADVCVPRGAAHRRPAEGQEVLRGGARSCVARTSAA